MRKIIFILILCLLTSNVFAKAISYNIPLCVTINGSYINFENEPVLIDGTTYLPVRFFCEAMSADVQWIDESQTVVVKHKENEITFKIGDENAVVNGKSKKIGGYAQLIGSYTYLPVRFIAESLGGKVNWNDLYYTVEVIMENETVPQKISGGRNYSDDEIYWLAKIISSESENQSLKGKIAVGNVVLNRVKSEEYPNTIYSVIFDKEFGVQFQPVANGSIYKEPVQDAFLAAKLCLEGYNVVGDCKYFLNPQIATSFWIPNNKEYYTTIGDHDFYY